MNRKSIEPYIVRFTASLFSALFVFAVVTLAGPPLVCHVFDIGNAKSLPWTSTGWNLAGTETYNSKNLALDTIAILNADETVLVHMETLRRATLYARKDPTAAKELLTKLVARSESAPTGKQVALADFDAGYLIETYKQWMGKDEPNLARGLDGYALVKKAMQRNPENAQINFAAALITLQGPADAHRAYAEKALVGAKTDSLLARNLAAHFHGTQGETMAEMVSADISQRVAAKQ